MNSTLIYEDLEVYNTKKKWINDIFEDARALGDNLLLVRETFCSGIVPKEEEFVKETSSIELDISDSNRNRMGMQRTRHDIGLEALQISLSKRLQLDLQHTSDFWEEAIRVFKAKEFSQVIAAHHICEACGKPNSRQRCSRCKYTTYCSPECQHADWKMHKRKCIRLCGGLVLDPTLQDIFDCMSECLPHFIRPILVCGDANNIFIECGIMLQCYQKKRV